MRVITILTNQRLDQRIWRHSPFIPFIRWRRSLRRRGYIVRWVKNPARVSSGDILLVDHRSFVDWSISKTQDWIAARRDRHDRTVWLDQSDSTGTTQFHVLPLVDVYAKRHLLAQPARYLGPHPHLRVHEEYYDRYFGNAGPFQSAQTDARVTQDGEVVPLDARLADRIRISWTFAYGDVGVEGQWKQVRESVVGGYRYQATAQNQPGRGVNALFRSSHVSSIGQARDLAKSLAVRHGWDTSDGPLPLSQYLARLGSSRICLSPFGWGEMCIRDFETAWAGRVLAKPSVSHLVTFPSLLHPWRTYIPLSWDPEQWPHELDEALSSHSSDDLAYALGTWPGYLSTTRSAEDFADHLVHCLLADSWCGHCPQGWWGPKRVVI